MSDLPYIPTNLRPGTSRKITDYTYFIQPKDLPGLPRDLLEQRGAIEGNVGLLVDQLRFDGRGIIARCFNGAWLSVTVRLDERHIEETVEFETLHQKFKEANQFQSKVLDKSLDFVFSFRDVAAILHEEVGIFSKSAGLIVVSGRTGGGKTQIVRHLVQTFLAERLEQCAKIGSNARRPHLISLEDPIEKLIMKPGASSDSLDPREVQATFGIDYTARQLPFDSPSLEQALMRDALRQTPAIIYVGEVRRDEDWKAILDFAGTGHLVITTTHASTTRETLGRILDAVEAKTPAQRGDIAKRILGIIQVNKASLGLTDGVPLRLKRFEETVKAFTPTTPAPTPPDPIAANIPVTDAQHPFNRCKRHARFLQAALEIKRDIHGSVAETSWQTLDSILVATDPTQVPARIENLLQVYRAECSALLPAAAATTLSTDFGRALKALDKAQRISSEPIIRERFNALTAPGVPPSESILISFWRGNSAGVAALVANGLSSVLPFNPPADQAGDAYSIGRRWFMNRLLSRNAEWLNDSQLSSVIREDLRDH